MRLLKQFQTFYYFFTKRFYTHKKSTKKHQKAPKAPKALKSTKTQPNKNTKTQISKQK